MNQADEDPGRPPRWTPLAHPTRLTEDSGEYYRDKNAARYPKHPMEPAILAGLKASPEICRAGTVDIVACGSTLGNLLRFVRGQDKSFRILVEMVEGTVFFVRRENSPTELIPDIRGFGHSFPENYTTWDRDVKGSASNERLLRYNFGGLRFLVRFGADGYIEEPGRATGKTTTASAASSKASAEVSEILSSLDDTRISSKASAAYSAGLKIQSAGSLVDQSCIFDLKTRSIKKRFNDTLGEELPRLWVAQIPKFILAYHDWGLFKDIQIHDVRDKVKAWEETHKDDLAKLASLVHQINAHVRTNQSKKLELSHDGKGVLEVREALDDANDALSPTVKATWIAGRQDARSNEANEEKSSGDDDIVGWKDDTEGDFTNCSGSCGYCGRCGSS